MAQMKEMLLEQLEGLLTDTSHSRRLARRLVVLAGCLAEGPIPEEMRQQLTSLSRLMVLQDILDPLVESLSRLAYKTGYASPERAQIRDSSPEFSALLGQIEQVRHQMEEIDPINFAEIIAWVISLAREQKIWLRK